MFSCKNCKGCYNLLKNINYEILMENEDKIKTLVNKYQNYDNSKTIINEDCGRCINCNWWCLKTVAGNYYNVADCPILYIDIDDSQLIPGKSKYIYEPESFYYGRCKIIKNADCCSPIIMIDRGKSILKQGKSKYVHNSLIKWCVLCNNIDEHPVELCPFTCFFVKFANYGCTECSNNHLIKDHICEKCKKFGHWNGYCK